MTDLITTEATSIVSFDPETRERVSTILDAGVAANTRRAYAGDLRYFWAWARLTLGLAEAYPIQPAAVVRFITDHLEGLPEAEDTALVAEGAKARRGVHSLATVSRRLAALSVAHEAQGVENPVHLPQVRALLSAARRGRARQGLSPLKKRAATLDVLNPMLETCGDDLRGVRDQALLLFAFASGGRRRSEVAAAKVENLSTVPGGFISTASPGPRPTSRAWAARCLFWAALPWRFKPGLRPLRLLRETSSEPLAGAVVWVQSFRKRPSHASLRSARSWQGSTLRSLQRTVFALAL